MSVTFHFSGDGSRGAWFRYECLGVIVSLMVVLGGFNSIAAPSLESDRVKITFSPETGGIISIVNPVSGHDFISKAAGAPTLWRLIIARANEKPVDLRSENCPAPVIHMAKRSVELHWKNLSVNGSIGGFDVRVKCGILSSDQLAHLQIDVENHSDASLLSTVFPEINGLGTPGKSDVAFPKYNWGEMFKGLKTRLYGAYPSADMPMQFFVLSDAGESLYFAAHDPGALRRSGGGFTDG